eukprot:scaffold10196_cov129-Isochrysis_galbana.AAC.2
MERALVPTAGRRIAGDVPAACVLVVYIEAADAPSPNAESHSGDGALALKSTETCVDGRCASELPAPGALEGNGNSAATEAGGGARGGAGPSSKSPTRAQFTSNGAPFPSVRAHKPFDSGATLVRPRLIPSRPRAGMRKFSSRLCARGCDAPTCHSRARSSASLESLSAEVSPEGPAPEVLQERRPPVGPENGLPPALVGVVGGAG